MAKKTLRLPAGMELSDDFKAMLDLLGVFTEASNGLAALENDCNQELLEIIDEHKSEYAQMQEAATKAEAALELIALRHPEWFQEKQSIATPYGTVKFHRGSKLEVPNPEVSILLIRQRGLEAFEVAESAGKEPTFNDDQFIRLTEELNLEALEQLPDVELAKFRITRVPTQSFSVKPAKIDMGKAVKESVATEAANA